MNQYYNQQGYQAYPVRQQGANQYQGQSQGFFPGGQQQFPQYPPAGAPQTPPGTVQPQGMLPIEQSYIENILRLNKGKLATVYATFEGNSQWNAKKFVGLIEAAGRDHLILSDPQTGQRTLIPMVAFDYATFDEELEYEYPFGASPGLSTFPPR
ncbi:spore germination protein Q [Neobacillus niacini]|uniref:spore coat protein GerQ n=1 Tax=Neobacillus niacini TaxID=86668 RepID=UPI0028638B94|nr:spore coat protein GerQ [Neobacillus niacini]MDR7078663.1 spore germination protein Q [Neobacillus niacini]